MGAKAKPQSKFACARETSRVRMEIGYRITSLDNSETTPDFLDAIDEACKITSSQQKYTKPPSTTTADEKEKSAQLKAGKATQELSKKKQIDKTSSTKPSLVKKRKTLIDIKQTLSSLSTLPAVQDSTRDYIIFNNKLYIAPDGATDVNSDSEVSLADGSFIADEYTPRLYLEKGEIVAIELWTKS
ncbi:hypothetical protein ES708_33549 [subsurface metagenome]